MGGPIHDALIRTDRLSTLAQGLLENFEVVQ